MNKERLAFFLLLFSVILLEISLYGLVKTENSYYIIAVIASTIASNYTGYCLISHLLDKIADTQKDQYYFFLNQDDRQDNSFFPGPGRWGR